MNRLVSLLTAFGIGAATACVPPAAAAAFADPDSSLGWSYIDPRWDGRRVVDVVRTQLDRTVEGNYRVRVYGRDFIKNETDIVRIYIDTHLADRGPEYRFSWYLGRSPGRPVQHTVLTRVEVWEFGETKKVLCPGMRHRVNYARDVIAVLFARRCLRYPEELRWAGFVGSIYRANAEGFWAWKDDFPGYRDFPPDWVGRGRMSPRVGFSSLY